jgi:hypothetical protein
VTGISLKQRLRVLRFAAHRCVEEIDRSRGEERDWKVDLLQS